MVPLTEQVEKYCCGLPKGIRDYCTKTSVMNMTQLIENAMVADNLVRGKAEGFKNPSKEQTVKRLPAKTTQPKQPFWKKTFQKQPQRLFLQSKEQKRSFAGKSLEEKRKLMMAGKCFICKEKGHIAAKCPQRRPRDAEDKDQPPKKKNLSSAGLVPDMVGDQPCDDASELCKAWGKIRDSTVLIFFDPRARANFITPALAAKLGIRPEEMGLEGQADLACPGHSVPVTPILGKLRMHIQSYVDTEEFYIMPLEGCDVLLDKKEELEFMRKLEKVQKKKFQNEQKDLIDELLPKATGREVRFEKKLLRKEEGRKREESPELLKDQDIMGGNDDFKQRLERERARREKKSLERNEALKEKQLAADQRESAAMDQFKALLNVSGGRILIPKRVQ
ncbi:hypothetical protein L7F22_028587 [Adiantum nelumboides]|nr:hypothetical protein [Adiantum nelumboides]